MSAHVTHDATGEETYPCESVEPDSGGWVTPVFSSAEELVRVVALILGDDGSARIDPSTGRVEITHWDGTRQPIGQDPDGFWRLYGWTFTASDAS